MNLMTFAGKLFKARGDKLPVICIFGCKNVELITPMENGEEEKRLDCRCYSSDSSLEQVLVQDRPHVVITVGNRSSYPRLIQAPYDIRRRWLHYDTLPDLDRLGISAYDHYLKNMFDGGETERKSLVTVFTPPTRAEESSNGRSVLFGSKPMPTGNGSSWTIRHIASTPNHIRAWRKSFYESIGGHNRELHVADDFEIIVRTFLKTRMVRVPRLCYLQHIGNTAQRERNKEIHRHVRSIRTHYDRMIHERFLELGCEDFAWDEENGCFDYHIPNPPLEPHTTLIATV